MAVQQYRYHGEVYVQQNWLEHILFEIGDLCDIRIIVENEATVMMTSVLSLAGGLLGGLLAGRVGFAAGAGLGGAAGYAVSKKITLRELWDKFKEPLKGVLLIIINHLKKMDRVDYLNAGVRLISCSTSRENLGKAIVQFIILTLVDEGVKVISSELQTRVDNCQVKSVSF